MKELQPIRVLFVFAWLVVGGEETEVRLLAQHLDKKRFVLDVVACFRKPGMPQQTHEQLRALGVDIDTAPYEMSFEETVAYLATKISGYDVIVSCQNVADIYPALERLHFRPLLIEHGGLVSEALAGPKHLTSRYVGVCRSIRDAAASRMPGREQHSIEIPSMVDMSAFDAGRRSAVRASLGIFDQSPLIGWVGRLDPKKNIEVFIEAAACSGSAENSAHFFIVGGPDAFFPEYAERLEALVDRLGMRKQIHFLGDRKDIADLMVAFDIFVWLSRGEGMPHVIAEAGAASLPVIATPDNGVLQQIEHGTSGILVPYDDPQAVAEQIRLLIAAPNMRFKLGSALRAMVERTCSVNICVPKWERLFTDVLTARTPARPAGLFRSFVQGGFECSTHKLRPVEGESSGRRLDMIGATAHDRYALQDYRQLGGLGIHTVRDAFRWHMIDNGGNYDWSSIRPMLKAAENSGTQVIWDLLHYGWPDDLDIWSPQFVDSFARFAGACARIVQEHSDNVPFYCPVNELSFFSWAGGDAAYLNPFARGRGFELKVQLARAAIAGMEAILTVEPRARFVHCEPAINVVPDPSRPQDNVAARGHHQAQFQALDLMQGRLWPQIGGAERYLDIIGINYYFNNQWIHGGPPIDIGHPLYKPLSRILVEVYSRYGRPVLIAETGTEGERRPEWCAYVFSQTDLAVEMGVPMEGICLYPIVNHPGWDDDRACENGLLSSSVIAGKRPVYQPLEAIIRARQQCALTFRRDDGKKPGI